jgi:hypothetical protein
MSEATNSEASSNADPVDSQNTVNGSQAGGDNSGRGQAETPPGDSKPPVVPLGAVQATLPKVDSGGAQAGQAQKPRRSISGAIVSVAQKIRGRKPGPHKADCGCITCKQRKPGSSALLGTPAPVSKTEIETVFDPPPESISIVPPPAIEDFEGWGEGALALWLGYFQLQISKTRKEGLRNNPPAFVEAVIGKLSVPDDANGPVKDLGAHLAKDFGLPPAGGVYVKAIPAMATVLLIFNQQMREVRAEFAKGKA